MDESLQLCVYCNCIRFECLSLPTVKEVEIMNSGGPTPERYPYQEIERSYRTYPQWSLGPQSSIKQRSQFCSLCNAILVLLDQWPETRRKWTEHNLGDDPWCIAYIDQSIIMRARDGVTWQGKQHVEVERLSLCWHPAVEPDVFYPGMIPIEPYTRRNNLPKDVSSKVKLHNCFQTYIKEDRMTATTEQAGPVIFNGMIRTPMLDPALPLKWMRHCLGEHQCGLSNEPPLLEEGLG